MKAQRELIWLETEREELPWFEASPAETRCSPNLMRTLVCQRVSKKAKQYLGDHIDDILPMTSSEKIIESSMNQIERRSRATICTVELFSRHPTASSS